MENSIKDKVIIVTSGPTVEPIDPVRYISNYSSGKQGFAIAKEFAKFSDNVFLISSVNYTPEELGNVKFIEAKTAKDMLITCRSLLPADIAVFAAAVADFRPETVSQHKVKKIRGEENLILKLVKNPDILAEIAQDYERRPKLVVGFAAESENLRENAKKKLITKGADWILANDISKGDKVFGRDSNQIFFISQDKEELWNEMPKTEVAKKLVAKAIEFFTPKEEDFPFRRH